jgi:CHAT domain-containing protein/Tfp pilus assembly protein PilF
MSQRRSCARLWIAAFLGLCLSTAAQEKPSTSIQDTQASQDAGALRTLAEQYFAAYARKDLVAMMALWSSKSPELDSQRKAAQEFFAANDKVNVRDVTVQRLSVEAEKAHLRVGLEMSAVNVNTGEPTDGLGKMVRNIESVKEGLAWKVWREKDAFDDLAESLISAETEASRTALMNGAKELATPSLQPALNKLGNTLLSQGDVPKARLSFQLMQQVAEATGDQKGAAMALGNMGTLSNMQGEHQQALGYFTKCIQTAQAAGEKRLVARCLRSMGVAHEYLSDYPEALRDYSQSLDIAESLNDRALIASTLSDIGIMKDLLGSPDEALEYYLRALAILETSKSDARRIARVLLNIAVVYGEKGDLAHSLEYNQKGLVNLQLAEDVETRGAVLNNIGIIYQGQGDPDNALEYYKKALALREQIGDKEKMAETLDNIGNAERSRKHYPAAMRCFQKALALSEQTGDKMISISTLSHIGELQAEQGLYAEALASYQKSIAIAQSMDLQRGLAWTYEPMARVYFDQGKYQESLEAGQHGSSIARKIGERGLFSESRTLEGLALSKLGHPEQARQAFEEAIVAVEELRSQIAGAEEQQQNFFENNLGAYHGMVQLLVTQDRASDAFSYSERAKSRTLLDILGNGKVNVSKAMTAAEKEHEQNLQSVLLTLNKQIEAETSASKPNDQRLTELKEQLEKARLHYADFQTNLYAAHPELKTQRGQVQPISVSEAGHLLPDNQSALLEFVVTEEKTYLFVLTSRDLALETGPELKIYTIDVRLKDLEQEAEAFRQQLALRDLQFRGQAVKIFRQLLQPAQTQLAGKTALVIVPDGPLWNLPFQALQPRPGHYLLEDCAIAYVPSLTVLREMARLRLQIMPAPSAASTTLLAMGNPALGKETSERARLTYRDESLEPLPEAEKEVVSLKRLYGSDQSEVYIGAAAGEDRFKAEAGKFRVLHLATHGIFNNTSPMYSHVVLSRGNADSNEDGLLEAWEIMQMDLKANLAVLSACETGRGRISAGEGMIGLTWAFFVAGVPTTVVSQWKVESVSTAKLMLAFHRTLKARDAQSSPPFATARALQHAELQLLHDSQYAHPFYWAGFVVMGDPQ